LQDVKGLREQLHSCPAEMMIVVTEQRTFNVHMAHAARRLPQSGKRG
jgi:hypothetical protein